MAPETITAYQQVDARSDIYSLGAVCYFLLTGTNVFEADTAAKVCTMHLYEEPELAEQAASGKKVPPDLEALILACLEKEPSQAARRARNTSARGCGRAACATSGTPTAPRRWWRAKGDEARAAGRKGRERVDGAARTIAVDLDKLNLG